MTRAHERKKEPEVVRRKLLDCASRLSIERGLTSLTLQAVADAAGVTKGGLLHHFPNKQALVEAVFADLLAVMDADTDRALAEDPVASGRFTRAYIRAVLAPSMEGRPDPWAALSVTLLTDPALREAWARWVDERLRRHQDTDAGPTLQLARYAADGVWLADLLAVHEPRAEERQALLSRLLALTLDKKE